MIRIPRRWILHILLAPALIMIMGWSAMDTWYEYHVPRVTGRDGLPRVSCLHCHRTVNDPYDRTAHVTDGFPTPEGIAVSADGTTLYVTVSGTDTLAVVDAARAEVRRSIGLPGAPHGVTVSPAGDLVALSFPDRDEVLLLDAADLTQRASIPAGREPRGIAFDRSGGRIFVASGALDEVVVVDVSGETTGPAIRLAAGNEPYAAALSADGALLAVANRLAFPVPPRVVPASEITLIDTAGTRVADRRRLESAHLSEGVAISSDGSVALAPMLRVRNLLPLTQVARGAVMTSAIAWIETREGGRTVQFPLDEVNAYFADPSGIALTPDDRLAFIAHGGADTVTVVDLHALRSTVRDATDRQLEILADDLGAARDYVLARIPTRSNPRALAMAPDGRALYVAERLAGSVAIVSTADRAVTARVDLNGPRDPTSVRRGERVFHDASITFQGQFSCRSCHPDGHSDGLIWDFEIDGPGRNLLDTRSLRGVGDTAPFKWNGKNPDLATQCGPRFARVLTRSDPFPPDQLNDLVAYIESIRIPAPRPVGHEAALERGRALFLRTHTHAGMEIPVGNRCVTCHPAPLFSDRLPADVGTGGPFDTPHLIGLDATAPYLHDGRAVTLEEIWTVHSPEDTHGVTADLTKVDLNDLVIYLRSL